MVREISFLQVQNSLTHLSENPIATELLIQISEEKNFSRCRIVGLKIHKFLCIYLALTTKISQLILLFMKKDSTSDIFFFRSAENFIRKNKKFL